MGKGTGLGLSITHQIIVEKHGGSLEVNSSLGQGTSFVVAIPVNSHLAPGTGAATQTKPA